VAEVAISRNLLMLYELVHDVLDKPRERREVLFSSLPIFNNKVHLCINCSVPMLMHSSVFSRIPSVGSPFLSVVSAVFLYLECTGSFLASCFFININPVQMEDVI
jgi:hypothetical protein